MPRTTEQAEAKRVYQRAYHAAHLEEEGERQRAHYAAHRAEAMDYQRAWRVAHRVEDRDQRRAYRLTHRAEDRERSRAYRAGRSHQERTPEQRESDRLKAADQRRRHPGRMRARTALANAVRDGRLVRGPCAVCGISPTHGHHHNGYDRAHYFDVIWLCSTHHGEAHWLARRVA